MNLTNNLVISTNRRPRRHINGFKTAAIVEGRFLNQAELRSGRNPNFLKHPATPKRLLTNLTHS
jgi:hypothetical protein